jgi:hypothetical protein
VFRSEKLPKFYAEFCFANNFGETIHAICAARFALLSNWHIYHMIYRITRLAQVQIN